MEYGSMSIQRLQSGRWLNWGIRFFLTAALTASQTAGGYAPFALGCIAAAGPGADGAAALLGGVFVGIGVGIIVRQGGSSGGDDALALVIHQLTGWKLARSYLFTDLVVLGASLSYIPARRIAFSLVTVTVSSLLIDWVQGLGHDEKNHGNDAAKEIE